MHKLLDMLLCLVVRPVHMNQHFLLWFYSRFKLNDSMKPALNTFLYHTLAMLLPTKQMVLNVKYNVSSVSVLTTSGSEVILVGFINYAAVTNDVKITCELCYIYLSCSHFL